MTTTANFRTDTVASAHFDRIAKTSISNAVAAVISMGYSVSPSDVPTPALTQLGRTELCMRSAFSLDHGYALNAERIALQLVQGQESTRRASDAAALQRGAEERAAFIEARVVELRAAYETQLLAGFRAQAEQDARERFDAAPVAVPDTAPVPHKSRKQAA